MENAHRLYQPTMQTSWPIRCRMTSSFYLRVQVYPGRPSAKDGRCGRRMPSWEGLLDAVAARLGENREDYSDEPLGILDAVADKHGRPVLENALRAVIDDIAFEPSDTHGAIAEIPWHALCTTNYDTLLERSLGGRAVTEESDYDLLQLLSV